MDQTKPNQSPDYAYRLRLKDLPIGSALGHVHRKWPRGGMGMSKPRLVLEAMAWPMLKARRP